MLGLFNTAHWSFDLDNPANQRFVAAFRQQNNGRNPSFYAGQAYDVLMAMDAAVRDVGGKVADKPALLKAIKAANYKSVRGDFRYGANNFPVQNYYLRVIDLHALVALQAGGAEEVVAVDEGRGLADVEVRDGEAVAAAVPLEAELVLARQIGRELLARVARAGRRHRALGQRLSKRADRTSYQPGNSTPEYDSSPISTQVTARKLTHSSHSRPLRRLTSHMANTPAQMHPK